MASAAVAQFFERGRSAGNGPVLETLACWAEEDPHAVDAALQSSGMRALLEIVSDERFPETERDMAERVINTLHERRVEGGPSGLCKSAPLAFEPTISTTRFTPSEAVRSWYSVWGHACGRSSPSQHHNDIVLHIEMPSDQARIQNCSPIPMILWPASSLLSKLLISIPEFIYNQRVLELGAGFHAVCALTCAHLGASCVVTTDRDGAALERMRANVARNEHIPAQMVQVERLDWQNPDGSDALAGQQFDVIIGSDIIHEVTMAPLIEDMMRRFLKPGGTMIMVNAQKAHRYGLEEFQAIMEQSSEFDCKLVPACEELIDSTDEGDILYDCYSIRKAPM